ncbi:MAG: hypothetical protein ABW221_20495 [Vicinamibacteria bacterium]
MKRTLPVLVLALAGLSAAEERGFKKPYFGATEVGTFARHKATDDTGSVNEYTYARLADVAGERVIELRYRALSGEFEGTQSTTACLVPASFPLANDALDFQIHARRCVGGTDARTRPTEYPRATMKAIAQGMNNYAALVSFKGTETVDGRQADRYGYTYKGNFKNVPATTTGDLWLSDAVPFGLVKEVMVTRDAAGEQLSRIETVLSEKGTGSQTALPLWSWEAAAKKKPAARQPR